jgi:hypothetical protein
MPGSSPPGYYLVSIPSSPPPKHPEDAHATALRRRPSNLTAPETPSQPPGGLLPAQQQVPPAEPLLLAGLAQHPADFSESRPARKRGQLVNRPAERRRYLVIEDRCRLAVGFEEGGQEVAAGRQHPGELGKVRRQLPWRRMNDGIPGHDAAQCAISQLQGIHRPDLKAQARMLAAGKIDHGRRQVQAEGVQP